MSGRKTKETENIENLCPIARKRSSTKSATISCAKLANCESASSPSVLTNELLEEMGISMLESEESSSSAISAIALAVSTTNTSDENSNEGTPLLNVVKLQPQRLTAFVNNNVSVADITLEEMEENSINEDHISSVESESNETLKQVKLSADKQQSQQQQQQQQHQNLKKLTQTADGSHSGGSVSNSNSPNSHKRTRNPLAIVTCNNQQQQQQKQQLQHRNNSPQLNVMPSTSKNALLMRQNLAHLRPSQLKSSFVANESFFLYRSKHVTTMLGDGKDHFHKLSDEMILHIFKWLPKKTLLRLATVCRRFNRCAKDESLWTRLDMGLRNVSAGAVEEIISRGVFVLRLAQSMLQEPVFLNSHSLSDFGVRLQYLDLSLATISKPSLKTFLSYCHNLKKLSLEHTEVNNEICAEIAKNTNLEALNMAMCSGLEAESIRLMMESLTNLTSFNISWTYLSQDAVTAVVAHAPTNLMRLNIAGCRKTMADAHIVLLAKRCPQLIELDLSDCSSLTSNVLKIICKIKMLEYLSVSRCYLITAPAFIDLRELPTLAYLDVFGMLSTQGMEQLENTFPKMGINKYIHSSVARPTVGTRRTSIWGLRTRDLP